MSSAEHESPVKSRDLVIHTSDEWTEYFGRGVLKEPVRFVPMHTETFPITQDFLQEYLGGERLLVSSLQGSNLFFHYREMKERMARVQFTLRVDRVPDVNDKWEIWIPDPEDPEKPAEFGLLFREDDMGPKSRDKVLMPTNQHLILAGSHFREEETTLFPVEGVTLVNPFEKFLSSGEEVRSQTIGISLS